MGGANGDARAFFGKTLDTPVPSFTPKPSGLGRFFAGIPLDKGTSIPTPKPQRQTGFSNLFRGSDSWNSNPSTATTNDAAEKLKAQQIQQALEAQTQAENARIQAELKARNEKIAAENASALELQNNASQLAGTALSGLQQEQFAADSKSGAKTTLGAQDTTNTAITPQAATAATAPPSSPKAAVATNSAGMTGGGMQSFGAAPNRRANMLLGAPGNGMVNTNQSASNVKFGGA
jgi:hypothetical protein